MCRKFLSSQKTWKITDMIFIFKHETRKFRSNAKNQSYFNVQLFLLLFLLLIAEMATREKSFAYDEM